MNSAGYVISPLKVLPSPGLLPHTFLPHHAGVLERGGPNLGLYIKNPLVICIRNWAPWIHLEISNLGIKGQGLEYFSAVKSTYWSYGGNQFGSQHPNRGQVKTACNSSSRKVDLLFRPWISAFFACILTQTRNQNYSSLNHQTKVYFVIYYILHWLVIYVLTKNYTLNISILLI